MSSTSKPRIFLSAGEASGDHYGAQLIQALQESLPAATFTGLGGLQMKAAGQDRVIRAEDVAVMGITEILRYIPHIYSSYRRLVTSIKRNRPDIAVLIDFPDVNFRLAKHLKRIGVPVIWFVSPQLWAWKKRRLRWVRERVDKMLVIFPFEEPFYKARGVNAKFIGHPLADLPSSEISREEFALQHNLDPTKQWIALLPGSRMKEVLANLPELARLPEILQDGSPSYQFLLPVASTLNMEIVASLLPKSSTIRLVPDARPTLFHARASVVASGTATVEAALIGNPFVVVYRVSSLTFRLAKQLVSYPPEIPSSLDKYGNLPIAMPNLIAGHRIVPELLQENFTAENIASELRSLLADTPEREKQLSNLGQVRATLHTNVHHVTAMRQLRDEVLHLLSKQVRLTS